MTFTAFIVGVLLTGPDALPPADPDVRAAINLYDNLEFGEVVPRLRKALLRPELSPADRRAALAYLGRAYAVVRQPQRAVEAFTQLLLLEPGFAITDAESPLIQDALRKARHNAGTKAEQVEREPRGAGHAASGTGAPEDGAGEPGAPGDEHLPEALSASPTVPAKLPADDDARAFAPPMSSVEEQQSKSSGRTAYIIAGVAVALAGLATWLVLVERDEDAAQQGTLGTWHLP